MPIYEYECLECGVRFDRLQRVGDPKPSRCPQGHRQLHKLFSQPAIIFKGSGFYATDHGSNGLGRTSSQKRGRHEEQKSDSRQEAG